MRSALAICWRISAEGRRSPRSIWLRYGLEMPASSDRRRSDSRLVPRCSRMKEPSSLQRSLGSVLTFVSVLRATGIFRASTHPDCAAMAIRVTSRQTTNTEENTPHGRVHPSRPALRLRRAGAARLGPDHGAAPRQAPRRLRDRRQPDPREAGRRPRQGRLRRHRRPGEDAGLPHLGPRPALDLLEEPEPRRRRQARRRARLGHRRALRLLRQVQGPLHPGHLDHSGIGLGRAGLRAAGPAASSSSRSTTTRATSATARCRCWSSTPGSTPSTCSTRT